MADEPITGRCTCCSLKVVRVGDECHAPSDVASTEWDTFNVTDVDFEAVEDDQLLADYVSARLQGLLDGA